MRLKILIFGLLFISLNFPPKSKAADKYFTHPGKREIASEGTIISVEGKNYDCAEFMQKYGGVKILETITAQLKILHPHVACKISEISDQDQKIVEIAATAIQECGTSRSVFLFQKAMVDGAMEAMRTVDAQFKSCK